MHLSKLPNDLCFYVLAFLTTCDVIHLETTSIQWYKHAQHWLGDAQSRRIRPLLLRNLDSVHSSLPPLLHNVYLPDLVLWSLAFRTVFKAPRRKQGICMIESIQTEVPRDVVHSLFTSSTFRNKTLSHSPMHEGAWTTAVAQVTDHFYFFLDFMYILGRKHADIFQYFTTGIQTFDTWCDRHKLLFFEQVSRPQSCRPSIDSLIRLSCRALSLVLSSRSNMLLKFANYVLWTVWGPSMPRDETPIFNPAHMPPTRPTIQTTQLVHVTDAMCLAALPSTTLTMPDQTTTPFQTLKHMFHLTSMQSTRWYMDPNFQFYIDILSDTSDRLMTFHVFRNGHISNGYALHQELSLFRDRIDVVYSILNTVTNQEDRLFIATYDPSVPTIQEPPELMCWKYIPIHTVTCQFTAYLHPVLQQRAFTNLMNPKIMARQQDSITRWFDEWFWTTFGLRAPTHSPYIHPRFSVVNCCAWDVFYSFVQ